MTKIGEVISTKRRDKEKEITRRWRDEEKYTDDCDEDKKRNKDKEKRSDIEETKRLREDNHNRDTRRGEDDYNKE